jgi:predicted ATPase/DNA integrity scanning protein DisA with diadenylate cyclase activity
VGWRDAVQVAVIAWAAYHALLRVHGRRALQLVLAVAGLGALYALAWALGLGLLTWLLGRLVLFAPVVALLAFQPELRAAVLHVTHPRSTRLVRSLDAEEVADEIADAAERLSRSSTGAIVAVERDLPAQRLPRLGHRAERQGERRPAGDDLHAVLAAARRRVVIRGDTIVAAGCILPLSQARVDDRSLGTRHRAALGLAEESDALVVVVSEETGQHLARDRGAAGARTWRRGSCATCSPAACRARRRSMRASRSRTNAVPAPGRGPALVRAGWREGPVTGDVFPWTVPAVRVLDDGLALDAPVTFFVGENGSGKSTLLEAVALAAQVRAVGSERDPWRDASLAAVSALARAMRLSWAWRPAGGFFLRAEDFFGHLRAQARTDARLLRERGAHTRFDGAEHDHDATYDAERHADVHPDEWDARAYLRRHDGRSHGESFLDYFNHQLVAPGLYLLDEPETPLSPQRQLTLLAMLMDAANAGAQLVVATHSPILLALPGARIYAFDAGGVRTAEYEELEHVRITRDFLNAPERFLRHLA